MFCMVLNILTSFPCCFQAVVHIFNEFVPGASDGAFEREDFLEKVCSVWVEYIEGMPYVLYGGGH